MNWSCPACGGSNGDESWRCICGFDATESVSRTGEPAILPPILTALAAEEKVDDAAVLPLQFTGSHREYFRIWIVNLCLTLLTFGIFSAWAKVRKKRYFYSQTLLDGTPFQYLGRPLPILKGRIFAAAMFGLYYVSSNFIPLLFPYVLAAGVVLAPWVIVRSAAFNARYSAFRNMTFRFDGSYRGAGGIVLAWGIVPTFVVGTMFDWWNLEWPRALVISIAGFVFPWWINSLKTYIVGHTSYGDRNGTLTTTGGQFWSIYFVAGLLMMAASLLFIIPIILLDLKPLSEEYIYLFTLPIYASYVFSYAYIQARSGNLVWNSTTIGPLRFRYAISSSTLAGYYLVNAIAIVASAGLLTPWAVIRTMKYKVENMQVLARGSLTEFRGGDSVSVGAAGAEMGEFFDMDLSI